MFLQLRLVPLQRPSSLSRLPGTPSPDTTALPDGSHRTQPKQAALGLGIECYVRSEVPFHRRRREAGIISRFRPDGRS
jgi:hypothetical protein